MPLKLFGGIFSDADIFALSSIILKFMNTNKFCRWIPVGEVDADQTSLVVEGLAEGKKYKFRVKAVNEEGESEPLEGEEAVEAKNPYTVPDPPQVRTSIAI
jgi:hypothetical protein